MSLTELIALTSFTLWGIFLLNHTRKMRRLSHLKTTEKTFDEVSIASENLAEIGKALQGIELQSDELKQGKLTIAERLNRICKQTEQLEKRLTSINSNHHSTENRRVWLDYYDRYEHKPKDCDSSLSQAELFQRFETAYKATDEACKKIYANRLLKDDGQRRRYLEMVRKLSEMEAVRFFDSMTPEWVIRAEKNERKIQLLLRFLQSKKLQQSPVFLTREEVIERYGKKRIASDVLKDRDNQTNEALIDDEFDLNSKTAKTTSPPPPEITQLLSDVYKRVLSLKDYEESFTVEQRHNYSVVNKDFKMLLEAYQTSLPVNSSKANELLLRGLNDLLFEMEEQLASVELNKLHTLAHRVEVIRERRHT